uniref:Uncharacterized protein n=1 Tax=Astyanax mexicanus TaxID=7994 RepID=A0A3B1K8J6_ASTMX
NQIVLKENGRTYARELNLVKRWFMQPENDPKHGSCSTVEWLKKNKVYILECIRSKTTGVFPEAVRLLNALLLPSIHLDYHTSCPTYIIY